MPGKRGATWVTQLLVSSLCFLHCVGTGVIPPLGSLPAPEALASVADLGPQMAATQLGAATGLSIPQRPTTTSLDQPQGMILSSALQPIPARLVRRIVAGEFVEMRDLLTDNVALHDQLEAVQGPLLTPSTPGALRARLREVPSLIS